MDGREAGELTRFTWCQLRNGFECRCACGWVMRYDDETFGREHARRWHRCPPPAPPPDEE